MVGLSFSYSIQANISVVVWNNGNNKLHTHLGYTYKHGSLQQEKDFSFLAGKYGFEAYEIIVYTSFIENQSNR
jgi:hypothetical protein